MFRSELLMKMLASIWLFRSCDWHCCAGGQMERDEGWGRYGSIHLVCLTFRRRVCVSLLWMHCFGWCQFLTFFCLAVSSFMIFTWWMIKQVEESHGLKSVQRSQTFGLLSKLWWKQKVDRQMVTGEARGDVASVFCLQTLRNVWIFTWPSPSSPVMFSVSRAKDCS